VVLDASAVLALMDRPWADLDLGIDVRALR
jgi:hypothetical protein